MFVLYYLCVYFQSVDDLKVKFDREMQLKSKDLSEEEFNKMLKQHQQEVNALQTTYNTEKDKQKKAFKDKVDTSLANIM